MGKIKGYEVKQGVLGVLSGTYNGITISKRNVLFVRKVDNSQKQKKY